MYTCKRMEIIQHQYLCTIGRTFLVREIVNKKQTKTINKHRTLPKGGCQKFQPIHKEGTTRFTLAGGGWGMTGFGPVIFSFCSPPSLKISTYNHV